MECTEDVCDVGSDLVEEEGLGRLALALLEVDVGVGLAHHVEQLLEHLGRIKVVEQGRVHGFLRLEELVLQLLLAAVPLLPRTAHLPQPLWRHVVRD
jgi:hypothetical protein